MFGIVQSKDGRDMVYRDHRRPPVYKIRPTGTIVPLQDVRLLAPVIPRSKVECVGKNYAAHATEMGDEVPEQALFFLKRTRQLSAPVIPS